MDDWSRAQELADGFSPDRPHAVLDRYAALCRPVLGAFGQSRHYRFASASLEMCDRSGRIPRDVREIMLGRNRRHLEHLSPI